MLIVLCLHFPITLLVEVCDIMEKVELSFSDKICVPSEENTKNNS